MIYRADCACYGGPDEHAEHGFRTERHHKLTFEAESKEDAVRDALRWYRRRQSVTPDIFFELWSIKVAEMHFTPVDAEGMCGSAAGWWFFEWKYDGLDTLEEKIQDLRKKEERRSA